MNKTLHIISLLLFLIGGASHSYAQEAGPAPEAPIKPRVMILGNVYGGGELAQVIAPTLEEAEKQLIQDADLSTLFSTYTDHIYTTYLHLGENSEVYGQVFGGGMGQEDTKGESAGRVTGQTDVALDGATVWSEIFGGGQMADVRGNTLVHFIKGKAGHNAFGGGLGVLGKRDGENKLVPLGPDDNDPDNRYEPLASADIKLIPANYELITNDSPDNLATLKGYYNADGTIKNASDWMTGKKTGESFVVFDGEEKTDGTAIYTHYEFEKARTVNRDENGNPKRLNDEYYTETDQFDANQPEHLFSIDHNIYGGGMTASKVDGKTFVHVNYGMVSEEMMNFEHTVTEDGKPVIKKVWNDVYNSIANAQFCVFGGGYGYHTDIYGDANVTFDIEGTGKFTYGEKFRDAFIATEPTWTSAEDIQTSANKIAYSHGAPGRSCMDIVGGGYNGRVLGTVNVTVGGDVVVRKVYGGGYYSSVGNTKLDIKSGIFNRIYGGGMIGNVYGVAQTTIGQKYTGEDDDAKKKHNAHLIIKNAVYGGNDVSGTVGTTEPGNHTHTNPETNVTYNVFNPVDDASHGVRLNLYGGLVIGDVYGAGNGNHPGYTNPAHMQFNGSQHPSENYRQVQMPEQVDPAVTVPVYKYRPRTARVVMTLAGNEGQNFNDEPTTDKLRIWGRTFGGGNSCNVGVWDGTKDDNTEKYASDASSWHPGDNFQGGGTIQINIGSHVQLGNRNDSHDEPNGLFMGSNGQEMVTQTTDPTQLENYHHYFNPRSQTYMPGFLVYDADGKDIGRQAGLKSFAAFINNILTWSDNVKLNIKEDADDVWMSNFVGGGYRGSMKAKTATGKFDYRLPEGVTVGHAIVGGSYNSHIVYRIYKPTENGYEKTSDGNYVFNTEVPDDWNKSDGTPNTDYYLKPLYEDPEHPDQITAILRYNFNGGMLSENSTGITTSEPGHRIHSVHADPRANESEYATAYFEPLTEGDNKEDDAAKAKLFTVNKDKVLVHLDLKCALHPLGHEANAVAGTPQNVHGGIVYGGCYMSGYIEGDSWVDYGCYLSPLCNKDPLFDVYFNKKNNLGIYGEVADLDRNNAMNVFGAGYGEDTHSMGDVYLYIKSTANSASGDDDPTGKFPYIFNAFGGSNMGEVSGNVNVYYEVGNQGTLLGSLYGGSYKGKIDGNTFVELAAGFVTNVYGGSRQADIMGASHVWAYDGKNRGVSESNHLIVSNLYGGNDVAGEIKGTMPAAFAAKKWDASSKRNDNKIGTKQFNTYVEISTDDNSANRGFPLIGSAFAGGNGQEYEKYAKDFDDEHKPAAPEVETALIEIDGGSILRAFGGGNMATVTKDTYIFTDAKSSEFASVTFSEYQKGIMNKVFFSGTPSGFKWTGEGETKLTLEMDPFHVVRLFGGNNLADMSIQPKWNLVEGRIENVYSGGNMGRMTYFNSEGEPAKASRDSSDPSDPNWNLTPRGLSITIDQPKIYIGSLFGGCRMADVCPGDFEKGSDGNVAMDSNGDPMLAKQNKFDEHEDYYGATVNITDGYIGNVYGGNDVSGTVYFGTNVNISGAVSGNVYGSGNGHYLYKWDESYWNGWNDKTKNPSGGVVVEDQIAENETSLGTVGEIYYHVKARNGDQTDTDKILTINHYRPSVQKAFLNIAGVKGKAADGTNPAIEQRVAYVKGNVYCGGNASTVLGEGTAETNSFTKFKIGSYVTLNGVFMGSDGYDFSQKDYLEKFEKINSFDLTKPTSYTAGSDEKKYYPNLLSVYMKAVEMKAQPKEFNLNLPLEEAYIGTYCGGGNRGSMLVDKKVELDFHHDIVIYDKIVGACLDANVVYKGAIAYGGYTRTLNSNTEYTKLKMNVASQFAPLVMDVPDDKDTATKNSHGENFAAAVQHGFLYPRTDDGKPVESVYTAGTAYGNGCNIYGGCYESGEVMGDIELNIYSNMLRYTNDAKLKESVENGIPCFNIYGAGFGVRSHVWGDVSINIDKYVSAAQDKDIMGEGNPTLNESLQKLLYGNSNTAWNIYEGKINGNRSEYPSMNNVFGGGRNGQLIGNTKLDIKNGFVYTDVVAGCYAADMYGSGQIVVGYPKYYECQKSAEYTLTRPDKWNTNKFIDENHEKPVLVNKVKYLKGEWIPENVYKEITDSNKSNYFALKNPTNSTWNDTDIHIGGGIYGGGYALTSSITAMAGSYTTWKLKDENTILEGTDNKYNFDGRKKFEDNLKTEGFGGNVSIMVADRIANGTDTGNGTDKDHIHISTLNAKKVNYSDADRQEGSGVSVIGKFIKETIDGKDYYTHQGDGLPQANETYYELSGTGGIYGDGHYVFCEGFRAADVTGYGYAEGTVNHPVLLNTFQRLDMLNINDCCLMLQGAQDFATDQIDTHIYSMTRVGELNMTSTLVPDEPRAPLSYPEDGDGHSAGENTDNFNKTRVRNYLGFFNNIHFLGSITSNDEFIASTGAKFHDAAGTKEEETYYDKKKSFIDTYKSNMANSGLTDVQKTEATNEFKKRNVGTARNCIGINNGYCLRIQNQHYVNTDEMKGLTTYYGPVVGVVEVKLLTLVEGEGGGYVYADNIHLGKEGDNGDTGTNHKTNGEGFLNVSGNFVFPGIVKTGTDSQYIVDDCYPKHYGTNENKVVPDNGTDAEAHYWYVEGNKYFFHTTLTGYTFSNSHNPFEVIKNDPNIMFAGLENGMKLNVASVKWTSQYDKDNYQSDLHIPDNCPSGDGCNADETMGDLYHAYGDLVEGASTGTLPYEFHIEVGSPSAWIASGGKAFVMDRKTNTTAKESATYSNNSVMPIFNVKLFDNVNNAPKGSIAEYYQAHLSEPEEVKIVMEARLADTEDTAPADYTYTITMRIVYLQGPSFTGGPKINNCALPGEMIQVTSEGITIETTEQLPVTAYGWKLLQPRGKDAEGKDTWQENDDPNHESTNPIKLDKEYFEVMPDGNLKADFPAYYYQNGWNIAYTFTAGGTEFVVPPLQETSDPTKQPKDYEKMFLVHNYHRMKEAFERNLEVGHEGAKGARIYIEDEDDLKEFINILKGTSEAPAYDFKDRNVYLMTDLNLPNDAILSNFKGTFDGFGHTLTITDNSNKIMLDGTYNSGNTCLGNNVASINRIFGSSDSKVVNLLVLDGSPDEQSDDYKSGKFAYELNNYYRAKREVMLNNGTDSRADKYVEEYYANGDYQYAGVSVVQDNRSYYLRTNAVPNYGSTNSFHNMEHTHDSRRWSEDDKTNYPLYEVDYADVISRGDSNDYIYFGQQIAKGTDGSYSYNDKRPYAIRHNEPLATYNLNDLNTDYINLGNMSNRVFRAEGFYHTKDGKGFYHNADAIVIDPYTTAVAFGDESMSIDQPEKGITSFNVDSNLDYAGTSSSYDNATTGHVTQNLLVYAMKSDAHDKDALQHFDAGTYDATTKEEAVRYHTIGYDKKIANFHLVDKQDFNAPYAFDVTGRAWYERRPAYYRNVTGNSRYNVPSAWEGIVLPFTVKKVTASENGEISHFYGNNETADDVDVSTLHHEYWLTGMVAADGSKASFARPSISGDGLFTVNQYHDDPYAYKNDYFWKLISSGDPSYKNDSETRNDLQWYKDSHTFSNYVYQTAGIPYLISFPGNDFYEFSMEGTGYNTTNHSKDTSNPQYATFDGIANWQSDSGIDPISISVSDGSISATIVGGHSHVGTYLHHDATENLYGISADENVPGAKFEANQAILPFRTYISTTVPSPTRSIWINSVGGTTSVDETFAEEELSLKIYGANGRLVIESNCDAELPVYNVSGSFVRRVVIRPGRNEYYGLTRGIYIINGKKCIL